jgi:hypothetical protein
MLHPSSQFSAASSDLLGIFRSWLHIFTNEENVVITMGKAKQTRKFAVTKKIISPKDTRVKENAEKAKMKAEELKKKTLPRQVEQGHTALFFQYNEQLGPPYHVLVDTNFINFSIR